MKQQKIYSIIIGLVAYIIISHIFHVFFRGKTDIALSLLYIYNECLQPIITQYFIDNKSEIWLLFLIAHSKR